MGREQFFVKSPTRMVFRSSIDHKFCAHLVSGTALMLTVHCLTHIATKLLLSLYKLSFTVSHARSVHCTYAPSRPCISTCSTASTAATHPDACMFCNNCSSNRKNALDYRHMQPLHCGISSATKKLPGVHDQSTQAPTQVLVHG